MDSLFRYSPPRSPSPTSPTQSSNASYTSPNSPNTSSLAKSPASSLSPPSLPISSPPSSFLTGSFSSYSPPPPILSAQRRPSITSPKGKKKQKRRSLHQKDSILDENKRGGKERKHVVISPIAAVSPVSPLSPVSSSPDSDKQQQHDSPSFMPGVIEDLEQQPDDTFQKRKKSFFLNRTSSATFEIPSPEDEDEECGCCKEQVSQEGVFCATCSCACCGSCLVQTKCHRCNGQKCISTTPQRESPQPESSTSSTSSSSSSTSPSPSPSSSSSSSPSSSSLLNRPRLGSFSQHRLSQRSPLTENPHHEKPLQHSQPIQASRLYITNSTPHYQTESPSSSPSAAAAAGRRQSQPLQAISRKLHQSSLQAIPLSLPQNMMSPRRTNSERQRPDPSSPKSRLGSSRASRVDRNTEAVSGGTDIWGYLYKKEGEKGGGGKRKYKGKRKKREIEEKEQMQKRRNQQQKKQALFRRTISDMDILKSLFHGCVIGDFETVEAVVGVQPELMFNTLLSDSDPDILASPFFREGDRPIDVASRYNKEDIVEFLTMKEREIEKEKEREVEAEEETENAKFLSSRIDLTRSDFFPQEENPFRQSVLSPRKKNVTTSSGPTKRLRTTPSSVALIMKPKKHLLSTFLVKKGKEKTLSSLNDILSIAKADMGNGMHSLYFDIFLKDFLSEGIFIENLVTLLTVDSPFRESLLRSFFLSLPDFTSPENVLSLLIENSSLVNEKRVAKVFQYWMSVAWEEDWANSSLKTLFTTELAKESTRVKIPPLTSNFLVDLLKAEGDVTTIKEISKKGDDDNDNLSVYGVTEGKERRREKGERGVGSEKERRKRKKKGLDGWRSGSVGAVDCPEWVDWDDMWITEQVSLHHWKLLSCVRPRELMRWSTAKNKAESCPNLWKFIEHFNELVHWLVSQIVVRVRKTERVILMEKVISLATLSLHVNNFFGAKSFFTAINHPAVSRLHASFECLSRESKENLSFIGPLLSMAENGAEYRARLKKCQPPYIPFVGIHTKDLIYYRDGNPDELDRGINFIKFENMWKVCSIFFRGLDDDYSGSISPQFQNWVDELQALSEDQMFRWSNRVEPKNVETLIAEFISNEIQFQQEKGKLEQERDQARQIAHAIEIIQQQHKVVLEKRDDEIQVLRAEIEFLKAKVLEKEEDKKDESKEEKKEERQKEIKEREEAEKRARSITDFVSSTESKREYPKAERQKLCNSVSAGSLSALLAPPSLSLPLPQSLSRVVANEVICLMGDEEEEREEERSEDTESDVGEDDDRDSLE